MHCEKPKLFDDKCSTLFKDDEKDSDRQALPLKNIAP